ncbi:MAG: hypothetical protein Q8Q81_11460, partial [Oxalobacteraceae bacterium]|nr:hypothetical protein [Oxalobacteraceae bacterium]
APVALRAPCAAPPIAISKDNYKTIKSDNKSSKTAYKGWGEGACKVADLINCFALLGFAKNRGVSGKTGADSDTKCNFDQPVEGPDAVAFAPFDQPVESCRICPTHT